jgi:hypothetical protein
VRGGDENHLPGAGKKISQIRIVALLVGGAQDLLDDQAAQAMADEGDRACFEVLAVQQHAQRMSRFVKERHGGADPVGRRRCVAERINRQSADVLGEPERPKRAVVSTSSPRIVGVPAKAVDKHDIAALFTAPIRNLDEPGHRPLGARVASSTVCGCC